MNPAFSKLWIPIILVIIIAAGGFLAWQYFGASEERTEDETANWQTYRNEEFGFKIQYPSGWSLYEPENVRRVNILERVLLTKTVEATKGLSFSVDTTKDPVDLFYITVGEEGMTMVVNGVSWRRFLHPDSNPGAYKAFQPTLALLTQGPDDTHFIIRMFPNESFDILPPFDQILSTFRFLK